MCSSFLRLQLEVLIDLARRQTRNLICCSTQRSSYVLLERRATHGVAVVVAELSVHNCASTVLRVDSVDTVVLLLADNVR